MNAMEQKLIHILYECNRHKAMLEFAYKNVEKNLPLTAERFLTLPADDIAPIDQFLYRFAKLQDSMGEKLFGTLLVLMGEDFSAKPFIDLLNRLEKLGLLYKDEWMDLRRIRNEVAHEYSFNTQALVDSLNDILQAKAKLIAIYDTFYGYCMERFEYVRQSEVLCVEK